MTEDRKYPLGDSAKGTRTELPEAGPAEGADVPYKTGVHVFVTLPVRYYGTIDCAWTDSGHVSVSAASRKAVIEFRGRLWDVRVDLFSDTGWTEATGRPGISGRLSPFTSYNRADEEWTLPKAMAPSHRAAVVAEIRSAVLTFLEHHPEVPLIAEANQLRGTVASEEQKAREAYEAARAHDKTARELHARWLQAHRAATALTGKQEASS